MVNYVAWILSLGQEAFTALDKSLQLDSLSALSLKLSAQVLHNDLGVAKLCLQEQFSIHKRSDLSIK